MLHLEKRKRAYHVISFLNSIKLAFDIKTKFCYECDNSTELAIIQVFTRFQIDWQLCYSKNVQSGWAQRIQKLGSQNEINSFEIVRARKKKSWTLKLNEKCTSTL